LMIGRVLSGEAPAIEMAWNPMKEFISSYLTPSERLSQALYGLILVLTVISAIGITISKQQQSTSTLLFAALGTSVAWGIVYAVIYVLTGVHERNHHVRVVSRVKNNPKSEAMRQIEDELEDSLIGVLDKEERDRIAEQVYLTMHDADPKRQRVSKDDVLGGIASFLISFIIVLPPVFPFVLNLPVDLAIRLSNLVAVAMLFVVGYVSGGFGGMNRIRWALTITVIGVIIVLATILLGG
jgi:VIT1/CCC1 family predicted Fe2+/Mn2+ transporter